MPITEYICYCNYIKGYKLLLSLFFWRYKLVEDVAIKRINRANKRAMRKAESQGNLIRAGQSNTTEMARQLSLHHEQWAFFTDETPVFTKMHVQPVTYDNADKTKVYRQKDEAMSVMLMTLEIVSTCHSGKFAKLKYIDDWIISVNREVDYWVQMEHFWHLILAFAV